MATTQGSKALHSDIQNWYTVFNNLASNYSSGITTLTVPSSGAKITAAQINNLHAKIKAFQSDYYLGTQAAWWPTGTNAVSGSHIKPTNLSAIINTVSNASKVKCKNIANYINGDCPNGPCNNGSKNNTCIYGTRQIGPNSSACTSGSMSNGACNPKGTCTSGTMSSGTEVLITCSCTTL